MKKRFLAVAAIATVLLFVPADKGIPGTIIAAATSNDAMNNKLNQVVDNTNPNYTAAEKADDITRYSGGVEGLRQMMSEEQSAIDSIAKLEAQYLEENSISEPVSSSVSEEAKNVLGDTEIKVVGAAISGAANLKVDVLNEEPSVDYTEYVGDEKAFSEISTPVYLDIDLLDNSDQKITSTLKVPVAVTVPVPSGMDGNKVVIFHMMSNESGYSVAEVIKPIYSDGKLTFVVTHFSTFAFAEAEDTTNDDADEDDDTDTGCGGDNGNAASDYDAIESEIRDAVGGSVVYITKDQGINALPNSIMKELYEKKTVSLVMECEYNGKVYKFTIPAGSAVNNDIEWYGPMYLAAHYSSTVLPVKGATVATAGDYTVQKGDTLSKIALHNGISMAELKKLNSGLFGQKYIFPGQKVVLK